MRSLFVTTSIDWGLAISDQQLAQFDVYAHELQVWSERLNLTAITRLDDIYIRHFLDSLRCALSWGTNPQRLVDIGAGAGFPGIPLKLLYPHLRLTLVESVEKKTAFLRHIVTLLDLQDVQIITARAETIGRDVAHREQYDVAVARAVADLRALSEYCLPLCRLGGHMLAPKGAQIIDEVERALYAITQFGGGTPTIEEVRLPGVEPRTLVVIEKITPTPAEFPRAVGVPAKRPL
jgi:16S rRNA (guanine527-N7)-methyltransferase